MTCSKSIPGCLALVLTICRAVLLQLRNLGPRPEVPENLKRTKRKERKKKDQKSAHVLLDVYAVAKERFPNSSTRRAACWAGATCVIYSDDHARTAIDWEMGVQEWNDWRGWKSVEKMGREKKGEKDDVENPRTFPFPHRHIFDSLPYWRRIIFIGSQQGKWVHLRGHLGCTSTPLCTDQTIKLYRNLEIERIPL